MKSSTWLTFSALSFFISQVPVMLAYNALVYTSLCDSTAWYESGKCVLDPIYTIMFSSVLFFSSLIVLLVARKVIGFLSKTA